jgi:hypothetical protein
MHLRIKSYIQLISFISNLRNVIYYQNVVIIPIALSCDHLFNYQLSELEKRFKEKLYLFISRFVLNFNPQPTFSKN